jgi:hypothetical protein
VTGDGLLERLNPTDSDIAADETLAKQKADARKSASKTAKTAGRS